MEALRLSHLVLRLSRPLKEERAAETAHPAQRAAPETVPVEKGEHLTRREEPGLPEQLGSLVKTPVSYFPAAAAGEEVPQPATLPAGEEAPMVERGHKEHIIGTMTEKDPAEEVVEEVNTILASSLVLEGQAMMVLWLFDGGYRYDVCNRK